MSGLRCSGSIRGARRSTRSPCRARVADSPGRRSAGSAWERGERPSFPTSGAAPMRRCACFHGAFHGRGGGHRPTARGRQRYRPLARRTRIRCGRMHGSQMQMLRSVWRCPVTSAPVQTGRPLGDPVARLAFAPASSRRNGRQRRRHKRAGLAPGQFREGSTALRTVGQPRTEISRTTGHKAHPTHVLFFLQISHSSIDMMCLSKHRSPKNTAVPAARILRRECLPARSGQTTSVKP